MASNLNLIPWALRYKFHRTLGRPKTMPISVTVSITNMCNSHCKTCFIWKLYHDKPQLRSMEFKADEFESVFQTLGKQVFYATISGGEPYLRPDLPEICEAILHNCRPDIMTIPTNGLLPRIIEEKTKKILENCQDLTLIVNISLDGIGSKHDEIRGVPGNFNRVIETYAKLKSLKEEFRHLQVGIHSVISNFNIDNILHVYEYVKQLDPDSYITEIAEQRTELFNTDKDITPSPDKYAEVINELSHRVQNDFLHSKKRLSNLTQAFRLTYYQLIIRELRENRQIIPCYAGYASCQITPYGDVWPCCVLGYDKPMGNLREADYNFKKVWFSKKADDVRKYIKGKNCACPLANAHYTNILCSFKSLTNVLWLILRGRATSVKQTMRK